MRNTLLQYLEDHAGEQLALLERLILQSSHTLDKDGVDRVGRLITNALQSCSLSVTVDQQSQRGDNLLFRSPACESDAKQILLLGHMDTVFPADSPFNYYREDQDHAYGPGIIDMKGGLATSVYVIKGLHQLGLLSEIPITFICNSDEEMGSTFSTDLIKREAAHSTCGLVFECGGLGGEIVTGRKGKTGYRLDVHGKAGHAAFTGNNGKASAILELAHKIIALEQLNEPEKQIVVNAGKITGGSAVNVVAESSSVEIDTRYLTAEDGNYCNASIDKITATVTIPGTSASLQATNSRYPMEQSPGNTRLFEIVRSQAQHLGMKVLAELRSGVSDANTLAECGIPVIDGLGPIGDLDHSDKEYMVKSSLLERTQLAALSVIEIFKRGKAP